MNTEILLSAESLKRLLAEGRCIAVDCRFDFSDPDKGRQAWLSGHIPGAAYAHLDDDLAAPVTESTGRHPLPAPADFARYLASIGWRKGCLLVAYDAAPGAIASRLWWLMRYFGQPAAVLDGGLRAWNEAGFPLESGAPDFEAAAIEELSGDEGMVADTPEVAAGLDSLTLVDARAGERFRGEVENLDTAAGHIPGALNRPFELNLGPDMRFKDPQALHSEFAQLLGDRDPASLVNSCGSGVTACHNLLAMELAGIGGSRVYPGSWSEWIRDPSRPIETGG